MKKLERPNLKPKFQLYNPNEIIDLRTVDTQIIINVLEAKIAQRDMKIKERFSKQIRKDVMQ